MNLILKHMSHGFILPRGPQNGALTIPHYALCVSPSCMLFDETRITKRCMAPRRIPRGSPPPPHPSPPRNSRQETSSHLTRVSANNCPPTRHESRRLKRSETSKASMAMTMLMRVLPFATESRPSAARVSCLRDARSSHSRMRTQGACIN